MGFIAPLFAQYPLGEKYTEWLYGDPQSNPYWDQPDKWATQSSMVALQDRQVSVSKLQFTGSGRAGVVTQAFNLAGGRNCIVFSRQASVVYWNGTDPTPPFPVAPTPNQQLPTQLWDYTLIGQRTVEGYREIDEGTPISNVFGTGHCPHKFPVPMMWNDKIRRELTFEYLINNNDAVDVSLIWTIAWLNTGA